MRTVSSCFAVLRQLRTVRRSVSRSVLRSLTVALVNTRLDYGNAVLAGASGCLLRRLQSVLNVAARMIHSTRPRQHVAPLLRNLHWLNVPERIEYKLSVLVYRCLHGTAPPYLARDLQRVADLESRRRLRSSSTTALVVPVTRRATIGDRAFAVAASRTWNNLPSDVTTSQTLVTFRKRLKTFLFTKSHPAV
jgi:hypothetical protein